MSRHNSVKAAAKRSAKTVDVYIFESVRSEPNLRFPPEDRICTDRVRVDEATARRWKRIRDAWEEARIEMLEAHHAAQIRMATERGWADESVKERQTPGVAISEGTQSKGGLNPAPSTPPPSRPKGVAPCQG
jgi:hypothetical protein